MHADHRHLQSQLHATKVTQILGGVSRRFLIDGTVGLGGHARSLLDASPNAFLLGIDRDQQALREASGVLQPWLEQIPPRAKLVHTNYASLRQHSEVGSADGILLDLGVSSLQLDTAERGFSFNQDAALDMRMDTSQDITAEDLVNACSKGELEAIFRDYSEEPRWRRVAAAIIEARKPWPFIATGRDSASQRPQSCAMWSPRPVRSRGGRMDPPGSTQRP